MFYGYVVSHNQVGSTSLNRTAQNWEKKTICGSGDGICLVGHKGHRWSPKRLCLGWSAFWKSIWVGCQWCLYASMLPAQMSRCASEDLATWCWWCSSDLAISECQDVPSEKPQMWALQNRYRLIWGSYQQRLETHFNRPPKILILVATPWLTGRVD